MASIHIKNDKKSTDFIITDRDDQFNKIEFYEKNKLTRVYKCRLENLTIVPIIEVLKERIETNEKFEIGYPNFLFMTEMCGDTVSLKFIAYPSDYYKIEIELGYLSDITVIP